MRRTRLLLVPLLALALVASACGGDDDDDDAADTGSDTTEAAADIPDGPAISMGSQDFGESEILAQVYGQALSNAGYDVSYQALGGFRDLVFAGFESGDINMTIEYAASALEFLNESAGEATNDGVETTDLLQGYLDDLGLVAFEPSTAIDSNSFVVTKETAEEYSLENVSDLAAVAGELKLGGPQDCPVNPNCIPGLQDVYGIDFSSSFTPLDGGGPLTVAALDGGEIDVAILFSTSGVIADKGWVVLKDDKGLIDADVVVPIATTEVADAYGAGFADVVNGVSAALTTEELTELNKRYDIDKEDADAIAASWLEEYGF